MPRSRQQPVVLFFACLAIALAGVLIAENQRWIALPWSEAPEGNRQRPFDPDDFAPMDALPEAMPSITKVPLRTLDKIDDEVRDGELVLGVTVGGASRAYPINQLTRPNREIFNDALGGVAIAATW